MADYKETQAAWARGRCIEQDQNGQVGRKVIELEHVRGEIKGAFFKMLFQDFKMQWNPGN